MSSPKEILEFNVKILSIDVGVKTQDILLYDDSYTGAFKHVMPSPTLILANKVKKFTEKKKNIVVTGETMGGGPFNHALFNHLSKGMKVYMTEMAAYTVRDDLDVVRERGIEIIGQNEADGLVDKGTAHIETGDIRREALESSLNSFGMDLNPEIVAIGVEDHGIAQDGQSDRQCRFEHFRSILPAGIAEFGFITPPPYYSRMMGVKRTLNADFPDTNHIIMDSKIAAMFGGFHASKRKRAITVDVGNGHITAASIEDEQITGIFEHHTGMLTRDRLEEYLGKFTEGTLTNEEIFNDGGHGCCIGVPFGSGDIIATGPRREILDRSNLNIEYINPYGDTMITGNVGLTECAKKNILGDEMKIVPNFKLWLEVDGKPVLGDGRAELLTEIDKCGSLSKAAKNLGISYRHAYNLIEDLNTRCGQPIILTSIGGTDGGGMRVTEFGRNLVKEFANIRKEIANYINEHYENRKP